MALVDCTPKYYHKSFHTKTRQTPVAIEEPYFYNEFESIPEIQ